MDLIENASPAVLLLGGLLALAVVVVFLRALFGAGRDRDANQVIAAQAERDVLRANHAVEVAALEAKLAEANERARAQLGQGLKLLEAERDLAAAREQLAGLREGADDLAKRVAALTSERDELAKRAGAEPADATGDEELRRETARQAGIIEDLQRRLAQSGTGAEDEGAVAALRTERDTAVEERAAAVAERDRLVAQRDKLAAERERYARAVANLRREVHVLTERASSEGTGRDEKLAQEVATLRERETELKRRAGERLAALKRTVEAHEATIEDLKRTLSESGKDGSDTGQLAAELSAAREREASANENLSRLAYERDGLAGALDEARRTEREAKAELERRDTLLELRQQKIYALEAELKEAAQRAVGSAGQGAEETAAAQATAEAMRQENAALLKELEALRERATGAGRADDGASAAAPPELEALRADNARLAEENQRLQVAADAASVDPSEVEALRASLRDLAARYAEQAKPTEPVEPAQQSLTERIRAYKAMRAAALANAGPGR